MIGKMILAAAAVCIAMPASAQLLNNPGLDLLNALKEGEGTKAYNIVGEGNRAVINYRGPDNLTPLHVLVQQKNGNWMGFLLAKGADPDIAGPDGDTPLITAARIGFGEGASRLIGARADVNRVNRRGETPLIVAVNQRQPRLVQTLLEAGADPDRRDYVAGFSAREYAKRDTRMPELLRLIETTKRPVPKVSGPSR
jgi:ankyrin repeat protein